MTNLRDDRLERYGSSIKRTDVIRNCEGEIPMTLQEECKWRELYRRAMWEKNINELLGSTLDCATQRELQCEVAGERKLIGPGRSFRNKTRALSLR